MISAVFREFFFEEIDDSAASQSHDGGILFFSPLFEFVIEGLRDQDNPYCPFFDRLSHANLLHPAEVVKNVHDA